MKNCLSKNTYFSFLKFIFLFTAINLLSPNILSAEKTNKKNEPDLLYIFREAYADVKFVSEYDSSLEDWKITLTIPDANSIRTCVLYWCNGAMVPQEELKNKNNYWTLLYNYNTSSTLPRDPSSFTNDEINRIRNFGSTDNRRNGAGTPMFFFDELYNSKTKTSLEANLATVSFLNKNVTVHKRIVSPLKNVESKILALSKTNTEVSEFVKSVNRNEAYYWRVIAGTNRKSFHSLGIALDIMPKNLHGKAVFWSWTKDYNPENWMLTPLADRWMPPQEVIKIFEDEGFIWGGKWAIWDNMHFEFHPELILYSKRSTAAVSGKGGIKHLSQVNLKSIIFGMKTFRKILKSALSAALITTAFSSCNTNYKNTLQIQAMNTYMTVQTYGIKSAKVNNLIRDRISMIENNISVTKENSDLYRLNNSNGKITAISRDTELLLNHSKQFYEITDNSFNPALYPIIKEWGFTTEEYKIPDDRKIQSLLQYTDFSKIEINPNATTNSPTAYLPSGMMIDFGAIGKGYASDEICKILSQNKIKNALIDLGGNIHTYGTKPDGTLWNIGIKNPNTGKPFASIKTRDMAVITSGGYERYFVGPDQKTYIHIFNPKNGRPVEGELASVTIVCPSGLYGDTLSTALFVMGAEKACEFWKNNPDFEFIFFFKDSSVWYSEGLKENLHIFDEINSTKMIISDK